MSQYLTTLSVPLEDPGSSPITHMEAHPCLFPYELDLPFLVEVQILRSATNLSL